MMAEIIGGLWFCRFGARLAPVRVTGHLGLVSQTKVIPSFHKYYIDPSEFESSFKI